MEDPRYYELRSHLIDFLNERSHLRPSKLRIPFQIEASTEALPGQLMPGAIESV
jgi:hypothetical protein